MIDLSGTRLTGAVVVGLAEPKNGTKRWLVKCDCGRHYATATWNITSGNSQWCRGCGRKRRPSQHGHASRNGSPTYHTWSQMKNRCLHPSSNNWANYGGRGIAICERWQTFYGFLADMGERPIGTTLDRVDPNGNYEKSNCRWADSRTQARNKRTTKLSEDAVREIRRIYNAGGITQWTLAKLHGVSQSTIADVVSGRRWAMTQEEM